MSLIVVAGICVAVAGVYVIVKVSTPTKAEREKEIIALIEQYLNSEKSEKKDGIAGEKKHMIDGVEVEVDKDGYIKKSW
ncbi:hypothetical protein [Candidatus Bathycorpusculum sp.]|uniref:hypothetical protein n=1 Tax=Candidatus Bathycorpusculum sp. TaxID=2994959 RepID=UPI0028359652|nr:hypothetical protein [Candidatus Termitimicrobium sp.]MCL2685774.1 hypothetical protein [Candidatus Termitimicrobium sp.]